MGGDQARHGVSIVRIWALGSYRAGSVFMDGRLNVNNPAHITKEPLKLIADLLHKKDAYILLMSRITKLTYNLVNSGKFTCPTVLRCYAVIGAKLAICKLKKGAELSICQLGI